MSFDKILKKELPPKEKLKLTQLMPRVLMVERNQLIKELLPHLLTLQKWACDLEPSYFEDNERISKEIKILKRLVNFDETWPSLEN